MQVDSSFFVLSFALFFGKCMSVLYEKKANHASSVTAISYRCVLMRVQEFCNLFAHTLARQAGLESCSLKVNWKFDLPLNTEHVIATLNVYSCIL